MLCFATSYKHYVLRIILLCFPCSILDLTNPSFLSTSSSDFRAKREQWSLRDVCSGDNVDLRRAIDDAKADSEKLLAYEKLQWLSTRTLNLFPLPSTTIIGCFVWPDCPMPTDKKAHSPCAIHCNEWNGMISATIRRGDAALVGRVPGTL